MTDTEWNDVLGILVFGLVVIGGAALLALMF